MDQKEQEYQKEYRKKNAEKIKNNAREHHKKNAEKANAAKRSWWAANREAANATARVWKAANREKVEEYNKRYCAKTRQLRQDIFRRLGDKCIRCGFSDHRALQIDHVKNNGAQHRREYPAEPTRYKNIWENIDSGEYQLLCANCNWIKRYEWHEESGGEKLGSICASRVEIRTNRKGEKENTTGARSYPYVGEVD